MGMDRQKGMECLGNWKIQVCTRDKVNEREAYKKKKKGGAFYDFLRCLIFGVRIFCCKKQKLLQSLWDSPNQEAEDKIWKTEKTKELLQVKKHTKYNSCFLIRTD